MIKEREISPGKGKASERSREVSSILSSDVPENDCRASKILEVIEGRSRGLSAQVFLRCNQLALSC